MHQRCSCSAPHQTRRAQCRQEAGPRPAPSAVPPPPLRTHTLVLIFSSNQPACFASLAFLAFS